jgi:hypothetical protein
MRHDFGVFSCSVTHIIADVSWIMVNNVLDHVRGTLTSYLTYSLKYHCMLALGWGVTKCCIPFAHSLRA